MKFSTERKPARRAALLSRAAIGAWIGVAMGAASSFVVPAIAQEAKPAAGAPPAAKPARGGGEGGGLTATDASAPQGPAPRNADGHPDLSGFWRGDRKTKPVGNIGKDLPGFKLPLTAEGEAALKYNLTQTIDPESRCIIGGVPRHDASGLPFAIVQNRDHVTFEYMYTYFRTIPFDVRKHEEDPEPRYFGDEIGWWDGDTFVIDTIGLKDHDMWIDENGDPQSGAMHVTERWTRPDAGHLHVEATIDDPKFYTHPFTYSRTWIAGKPTDKLIEALCTENNADLPHLRPPGLGSVRADGSRGYDNGAPLPDNPPPPPASYDAKPGQKQ